MKHILAFVLCLCLCLCACTTQPDTWQTQTTTQPSDTNSTSISGDDEPIAYTEQLIAVSIPMITENTLADDGTCIFTYSCQDITLTMDDPVVAEQITDDFLHRNDFSASAQSIQDAAKAAYSGQQDWTAYSCSVIYNPIRLDQSILSFYGTEVVYNGGPRSSSNNISVTYDLNSGEALSLREILVTGYSAEDLVNRILAALEDLSKKGVLFADYEYIISDLFSTNTPMERWFFSDAGLCFYFTPYEIAPYNAGTVIAEVPYGQLIGILKDAYFPAEQVCFEGTMTAVNAGSTDLQAYNRFTEVILDNQGAEYVIAPKGTALNVRLQLGQWNDGFTPSYTVYAATGITDGDAILLQLPKEQAGSLAISYNDVNTEKIIP